MRLPLLLPSSTRPLNNPSAFLRYYHSTSGTHFPPASPSAGSNSHSRYFVRCIRRTRMEDLQNAMLYRLLSSKIMNWHNMVVQHCHISSTTTVLVQQKALPFAPLSVHANDWVLKSHIESNQITMTQLPLKDCPVYRFMVVSERRS